MSHISTFRSDLPLHVMWLVGLSRWNNHKFRDRQGTTHKSQQCLQKPATRA